MFGMDKGRVNDAERALEEGGDEPVVPSKRARSSVISSVQTSWQPMFKDSDCLIHMTLPINILERIMAISMMFKELGLTFKPEWLISVYTSGGLIIQCWKLEKQKIEAGGHVYYASDKHEVGISPAFVHALLSNNVPADVSVVELAMLKSDRDSLRLRIGSWVHEVPLIALSSYRCHKPDDNQMSPMCVVEVLPKQFGDYIRQCARIPVARREKVLLEFRNNGVGIKTVSGQGDIRQQSCAFLAWADSATVGDSTVPVGSDTTAVSKIIKFRGNVNQTFDMRMLSTIVKPAVALSPSGVQIQAQDGEPLVISFNAGRFGTAKFYLPARIDN
jgi:hypothetical protein